MVKLSNSTINKSCKIVRAYLPFSFILEVFRDITGDQDLATFPNVRKSEEAILRTSKVDVKIPFRAVDEISDYFYQEQNAFLDFLKSLTPRSIRNQVVFGVTLDDFISRVSAVLFEDSRIKIENYGIIQQWVPNTANKGIFLNIDVPDHIRDYFGEALDCSAHNLHRSSILFSTFTLEASLRYKYAELANEDRAHRITLNKLIDWGINRNLIEKDQFNKVSVNFIRDYRNDLAHCNMNKPNAELKISREYAQKRSNVIIYLVELFVNSIFY